MALWQDKFLSRREAIMGEVAKNNESAEEEEVGVPLHGRHRLDGWHQRFFRT